MRRAAPWLVLAAGWAACHAGTETVVVVSAGDVAIPGDVDKVRVLVTNTLAGSPDLPLCTGGAAADCLTMPMVATLIPGPDHPGDEVQVEVTAYLHGQPVIRDGASFVFQSGQRERLDFVLYKSCLGNLSCAGETPAQSCGADGRCALLAVTPLGAHPRFDGGSPPAADLGNAVADLSVAADLRAPDLSFVDLSVIDLSKPDLTSPGSFATAACVAADSIPAVTGFVTASCDAYCAGLGTTCADNCTTNRGFPAYGVEAWTTAGDCAGYLSSAGQAFCSDDLSQFSSPSIAKYRCCCH